MSCPCSLSHRLLLTSYQFLREGRFNSTTRTGNNHCIILHLPSGRSLLGCHFRSNLHAKLSWLEKSETSLPRGCAGCLFHSHDNTRAGYRSCSTRGTKSAKSHRRFPRKYDQQRPRCAPSIAISTVCTEDHAYLSSLSALYSCRRRYSDSRMD